MVVSSMVPVMSTPPVSCKTLVVNLYSVVWKANCVTDMTAATSRYLCIGWSGLPSGRAASLGGTSSTVWMKWFSPSRPLARVAPAMVRVGRKPVRTVANLAATSRGARFSIVSSQSRMVIDAVSVSIRRVTWYRRSSDVFVSVLRLKFSFGSEKFGVKLRRMPGNLCRREVAGRIGAFLKPDGNRITRCYRV